VHPRLAQLELEPPESPELGASSQYKVAHDPSEHVKTQQLEPPESPEPPELGGSSQYKVAHDPSQHVKTQQRRERRDPTRLTLRCALSALFEASEGSLNIMGLAAVSTMANCFVTGEDFF